MWMMDQTDPEWYCNRKANTQVAGSGGLSLSQAPWIAPRQPCLLPLKNLKQVRVFFHQEAASLSGQ